MVIACEECGSEVTRIPDVGDVWLDAGIVPGNRNLESVDPLERDARFLTLGDRPIHLAEPLPETKIVIDELVVTKTDKLPIDPGDHVLVVSAPGRLPFKKTVHLEKGEERTLEVPALATSLTVRKVVKSSRARAARRCPSSHHSSPVPTWMSMGGRPFRSAVNGLTIGSSWG